MIRIGRVEGFNTPQREYQIRTASSDPGPEVRTYQQGVITAKFVDFVTRAVAISLRTTCPNDRCGAEISLGSITLRDLLIETSRKSPHFPPSIEIGTQCQNCHSKLWFTAAIVDESETFGLQYFYNH